MKSCTTNNTWPQGVPTCRFLLLPLFLLLFSAVGLRAQYTFASPGTIGNLSTFSVGPSGGYSSPVLVDLNGDHKLDIVTGNRDGKFEYYQNNGTALSSPLTAGTPTWTSAVPNPFSSFDVGFRSTPAFVDIDDDGDLDMFSGNAAGEFRFFENTTAPASTTITFEERIEEDNPLTYPDVFGFYTPFVIGANSTIGFLDADNDDDFDIVAGNANGEFFYFENEGDQFTPYFPEFDPGAPRTNSARPSPQVLQDIFAGISNDQQNATVGVVDMNCDGVYDIVSGSRMGRFQFRQLSTAPSAGYDHSFTTIGPGGGFPLDGLDISPTNHSDYSYPAAGDLDGDGDIDFITGRQNGGFMFFKNNTCNTVPTYSGVSCGTTYTVNLDQNNNTEHALVPGDIGSPTANSGGCFSAVVDFSLETVNCSQLTGLIPVTITARNTTTGVKSASNCVVYVDVVDNTLPSNGAVHNPVCGTNYKVQLNAAGQATLGTVSASSVTHSFQDNCSFTVAVDAQPPSVYTFTCTDLGVTPLTINLRATDASNNSSTCSASIEVVDLIPPTVTPATLSNVTRTICDNDPMSTAVVSNPLFSVSDNCASSIPVVVSVTGGVNGVDYVINPSNVTFNNAGTYVITHTFTAGSATTTRTQQVQVNNVPLQVLNCPVSDVVVNMSDPALGVPPTCQRFANWTVPTADDCGAPGTPSMNSSHRPFSDPSPSAFSIGTTTVSYLASDGSGNTALCTFRVIVNDDVPPSVTLSPAVAPAVTVATQVSGQCGRVATWPTHSIATATDNCSNPITLVQEVYNVSGMTPVLTTLVSGSLFPYGSYEVRFYAVDSRGQRYLQRTLSRTITDTQAPTITCPLNLDGPNTQGECYGDIYIPTPTAVSDNCTLPSGAVTGPVFSPNPMAPPVQALGGGFYRLAINDPRTVTFTITDANGLTGTCSFTVDIDDEESPRFTKGVSPALTPGCPSNIGPINIGLACTSVQSWTHPNVAENCNQPAVSFTVYHPDGSVNTSGTVVTTAPLNVGAPDAGLSTAASATFREGVSTVRYLATDAYMNTSSCSFTVTITNNTAPTFSNCPPLLSSPIVVSADAAANSCFHSVVSNDFGLLVNPGGVGCDVGTVSYVTLPANTAVPVGAHLPLGVHVLKATVSDVSGNTNSCQFQIEVRDMTAPTVSCPASPAAVGTSSGCTATVSVPTPLFQDNCTLGPISISASGATTSTSGLPATFNKGVTNILYSASDAAGNAPALCVISVTVNDDDAPTLTCPAKTLGTTPTSCMVTVDAASLGALNATDNCDGSIPATLTTPAASQAPGTYTVNYTVTDAAGLTSTCSRTVTVVDDDGPVVTCPASFTVTSPTCSAPVPFATPTALDNCDGARTVTGTHTSGSTFTGVTTVTFSASDTKGNTGTCSFTISVVDGSLPALTCPGTPINIPSDATDCNRLINKALMAQYNPAVTNGACAGVVTFDNDRTVAGADVNSGSSVVVTWTGTNMNGSSTCSRTVFVRDSTPPVPTCPPAYTATLLPGQTEFDMCQHTQFPNQNIMGTATAVDNCVGNIPNLLITYPANVPGQQCQYPVGTHTIYWRVRDAFLGGNTAQCTQTLIVQANNCTATTPSFTAGSNCGNTTPVSIYNGNCPQSVTVTAAQLGISATDNCGNAVTVANQTVNANATGNQVVTFTATVGSNTVNCARTVAVTCTPTSCTPTQLPSASCPANTAITVQADAGECYATTSTIVLGNVLVSDNCTTQGSVSANGGTLGTISVTNNAAAQLTAGMTHNIMVSATNSVGTVSACVKSVTVNLNTEDCSNGFDDDCDGLVDGDDPDCSSGGGSCVDVELSAPTPANAAQYGASVDIYNDIAVVGAPFESNGGRAYVYQHDGLQWNLLNTLSPSDVVAGNRFGTAVATDGNRVIVGGNKHAGRGAVWMFDAASGVQIGNKITSPGLNVGDDFGTGVDIDGNTIIVGAPFGDLGAGNAGAAYIYQLVGSTWTLKLALQSPNAVANGYFGSSVAMEGATAAVGARQETVSSQTLAGVVYAYFTTNSWTTAANARLTQPTAISQSFMGCAVDISGNYLLAGAYGAKATLAGASSTRYGEAYLFTRANSSTNFAQANYSSKLVAPAPQFNDQFGRSVAIEGSEAMIGAPQYDGGVLNSGRAFYYDVASVLPTEGSAGEVAPAFDVTNDQVGAAVGISCGTYIVGVPGRDNGGTDRGSVIVLDGTCLSCPAPFAPAPIANRESAQDATFEDQAQVFPNPASDVVNIEVALIEASDLHVMVVDATGRVISELFNGFAEEGVSSYLFDSAAFEGGLYFIRIESANLHKVVPVAVVK